MKILIFVVAVAILVLFEIAPVSADRETVAESYLETCVVTQPNGSRPPGESSNPYLHGNGNLWTALFPNGLIEFGDGRPGSIGEDGALGMKFPWWRGDGIRGPLKITGKRLDGSAPPAYGDIPDGYGESGFQASGIFFPTEGCWEITGSVGDIGLTFVQYVRLIR